MREYASPLRVTVPTGGSLTDDVISAAVEVPQTTLFSRRVGEHWVDVTAEQFRVEVTQVAKGLLAAGVRAGDRVLLISKTRYEWTLVDYAIWWAGAVTVPVFETSSADQIAWIITDSAPVAAVAETAAHRERVTASGAPEHVWQLDDGAVATLTTLGAGVSDAELEERRATVAPDSLATVVYTSGTTGRPKGCALTHGNFLHELGVAVDELGELFDADQDASTLLFLPLAHVFARVVQVGCVRSRVRLGHSAGVSHLLDDLAAFQPTFLLSVPRVWERIFDSAAQQARGAGRGKAKVFDAATATAVAYSEALDAGKVGLPLRLRHRLFDRCVYAPLRGALGGRIEYAVSGGAPLDQRLSHFLRGVGVQVLEGYGLTETTAAVTVNLPGAHRIGSVGRPLQGAAVRVADDGEVLVTGGQVFRGYWRNERATAEALTSDGWFRTGDLGRLDDDGFLRITGRKKEIVVTAGGKSVAPAPLEDAIRTHPLVSQCIVVGEAKPFVGALVTLDPEPLAAWADRHGKDGRTAADLRDDPDLVAEVQSAVDRANHGVSRAEAVRKVAILAEDWSEEAGQLTPTMKVRRSAVAREFADEIEGLYT
ncbi:MAG TPA: AMP-dependent synthetase/ligase [Nocardioidaceae bacterium]|nr:AMP-dependent synthetase/ligase [Nocardioidaceae bacterium]